VRRPLIAIAAVLAGALLAACGKGGAMDSSASGSGTHTRASTSTRRSSPAPRSGAPSRARALAFAHAVNLTSRDVPGFAVSDRSSSSSATEKRLERQMLQCSGIAGPAKAVAEQSSKSFRLKHGIIDLSVSSEVAVEPSAAEAQRTLAAIRSAHVRACFTRFLEQIFRRLRVQGASAGPVTIQSGTPPAPGMNGSFGWRVTATFNVKGLKLPIYLDFLGFIDGPSEVTLLSSGLLRPFPAEVQQHLFTLLLRRARASKL
jgi:hypothetical protein